MRTHGPGREMMASAVAVTFHFLDEYNGSLGNEDDNDEDNEDNDGGGDDDDDGGGDDNERDNQDNDKVHICLHATAGKTRIEWSSPESILPAAATGT